MPIQLHTLADCPVPSSARIDLFALGDFPSSNRTSESLALNAGRTRLTFPPETSALEAQAHSELSEQTYIGYAERLNDRLDFLLWPKGESCDLFSSSSYPRGLGGEASGYAEQSGVVLIAGSDQATSSAVVGAFSFDTRTGESRLLEPRDALSEPRAYATVTEFGAKLLVAGGENPIHDAAQRASVLRDTGEVYDPARGSFEPTLLKLVEPTTHHAAVSLLSGETALIGGRNAASEASSFIQLVSPNTASSKLAGTLAVGRTNARALRLSDGRLFIGGGEDAAGKPVAELEWRGPDASPLDAPFDGSATLPARFDRAFAALPGGAVLAVGGCEDRDPSAGEDCKAWCQRGCPPRPQAASSWQFDAFWISAEGAVLPLDFPIAAGSPVLLAGSDGAPWLIASDTDPDGQALASSHALYRFDPWRARFTRSNLNLSEMVGGSDARFVSTGLDAFIWIQSDPAGQILRGMRVGTRNRFASDLTLVALRDPNDITRPAHLVPDHPPGTALRYDSAAGELIFDPAPSDSAICAWLSDAEYGDFSAQIEVSGAILPKFRLGDSPFPLAAGSDCALPALPPASKSALLMVRRKGSRVSLRLGAAESTCQVGTARAPLAVCSSELGRTVVRALSVVRAAP